MKPGIFTVYCIKHKKTKREYFGRTKHPVKRFRDHFAELHDGAHYNRAMQADHTCATDWTIKIIQDGMSQLDANHLSDDLAKEAQERHEKRGTAAPYNQIGIRGGRAPTRKLSDEKADEIRILYESGNYRQSDLAENYGVTQGIISLIVSNLIHNPNFEPRPSIILPASLVMRDRKKIRARVSQLTKKMPIPKAYEQVAGEYGVSTCTIKKWVETRPEEQRRLAQCSNLNHGERKTIIIDGERFKGTKTSWEAATGENLIALIKHHEYVTYSRRQITIDGEKVSLDGQSIPRFAKSRGLVLERIDRDIYMTYQPKEKASPWRRAITVDGKEVRLNGTVHEYALSVGCSRLVKLSKDVYETPSKIRDERRIKRLQMLTSGKMSQL